MHGREYTEYSTKRSRVTPFHITRSILPYGRSQRPSKTLRVPDWKMSPRFGLASIKRASPSSNLTVGSRDFIFAPAALLLVDVLPGY
jgi:hypothetical protein